jgi:hypothetical protein
MHVSVLVIQLLHYLLQGSHSKFKLFPRKPIGQLATQVLDVGSKNNGLKQLRHSFEFGPVHFLHEL